MSCSACWGSRKSVAFIGIFFFIVCSVVIRPSETSTLHLKEDPDDQVEISCNNGELLNKLQKYGIPYRCSPGTKTKSTKKEDVEQTGTIPEVAPEVKPEQATDSSGYSSPLPVETEEDSSSQHDSKTTPLESKIPQKMNLKHCGDPGYIRIPELGGCFHFSEVNPDPLHGTPYVRDETHNDERRSSAGVMFNLNIPFVHEVKCVKGHRFVDALGLCLPEIEVESFETPIATPIKIRFNDRKNCPTGTVYSSEIDICMPYTKPPRVSESSMEFVSDDGETAQRITEYEVVKLRCPHGMAYVSELHLCASFTKPSEEHVRRMKTDAQKRVQEVKDFEASTTPSPFRLTIKPIVDGKVGAKMCKSNEIYLSELDICMEYESKPKS